MRAGDRNMNDELEKIRKYWNFRAEGFNDSDIPSEKNNAFLRGLKEDNCGRREMLAILDYLWQNGITPEIFYEKEVWTSELTAERAAEGYIRTLSLDGGIKDGAVEEIKRYFESIAENGMIRENTDVIICTMYWSEK